ncbi:MAG: GTPase ObgE [Armatimonadetes bacterium]|nr:GTPase ObgE [Armatimonadota bacterium]
MQFVDQVDIIVKAGDGGNGIVAFRREKYIPRGGPAGGNGGRGGNIIIKADADLNTLVDLRYKKHYKADRGGHGGPNDRQGKKGKDLTLRVPVGTVVLDAESERMLADLTANKQKYVAAKGGEGGRGNASFATSTQQTPKFAERGEPTDEIALRLELKLLADVGLIGYPSVGKSTLISKISAAKPKIADYPFTTLVPNLGVVKVEHKSFVVADMPGLIEGAHQGAGLGHLFLRHIERTRLLVHIIDVSGYTERNPMQDFDSINDELRLHSDRLAKLPQIVALNKADMSDAGAIIEKLRPELESIGLEVFSISALTGQGLPPLVYRIMERLEELAPSTLQDTESDGEVVRFTAEPADSWDAHKVGDNEYEVDGRAVEMLVRRTDLSNEYALRRLHRQFDKIGVIKALKKLGVNEGDTVRIYGIEFEYTDEIYG